MRFDAYNSTTGVSPEKVLSAMLENIPYEGVNPTREKGQLGYEFADIITDGMNQKIVTVLHGGNGGKTHVRAQGVYSPDVATIMRGIFPDHLPSRVDVAVDFDGTDAFQKLYRICFRKGRERGLKLKKVSDPRHKGERDPLSGTTLYVGSRQSVAMVRCYEKGKEMLSKNPDLEHQVSLDLSRLEIEVKPQNEPARRQAAKMAPEDFWGVSTWSRDILREAMGLDVERVNMNLRPESEDETALKHMIRQYRSALMRESARAGITEVQLLERLLDDHDRRAREKCGPAWHPLKH